MAWIEVHQAVVTHRKTLHLARLLGIDRPAAVGILVGLWLWAVDNADASGHIERNSLHFGSISGDVYRGRKRISETTILAALVECGWVDQGADGNLYLHDWPEYGGRLLAQRVAHRARNRRAVSAQAARSLRSVQNTTVHNTTSSGGGGSQIDTDRAREAPERPPLLLPGDDVDGGDDDGIRPQLTVIQGAAGAAQAATAVAVADAALPDFDVGRCSAALQDLTGRPTSTAMKRHIRNWLLAGGTTQTFVDAAEHAALHDGRSLEYVITIADRWQREGHENDRRPGRDPAARTGRSRFGTDAAVDAAIAAARRSTEP